MTTEHCVINGWPGIRLVSGKVSVGFIPQIGGRIMSFNVDGHEWLYAHAPEAGNIPQVSVVGISAEAKQKFGFRLWGGDKTWVSPEWAWVGKVPPLDLDAGVYDSVMDGDVYVMISPVCRETGLQVLRRVRLEAQGVVHLTEELHNTTDHPIRRGIWNVTQVSKPFDVCLPAAPADIRSYHLSDETLPDPAQTVEPEGLWSRVRCASSVCFKFGGMVREGKVVVVKDFEGRKLAWTRTFDIAKNAAYAHDSMVEVFNSHLFSYGEVELHAPLVDIPPRKHVSLTQVWQVGTEAF